MVKLGKFVASIFCFITFLAIVGLFPLYAYIMEYGPKWIKINNGACIGPPLTFIGIVLIVFTLFLLSQIFKIED